MGERIDSTTRWHDGKGREWRVLDSLSFGRYLCVLVDRPAYSGNWTSREIRAALGASKPGEVGR